MEDTQKKVVLTGIRASGEPHIGNYFGAIKPAIEKANSREYNSYLFIADYHALTTVKDPHELENNVKSLACTWLACGLDTTRTVFYRQSSIPEVFELTTILSNTTAKGVLNRAHAYKAQVASNLENDKDADDGISVGLFCYPLLMSSDILLFNANLVPVGVDQKQHVEIAADVAKSFNATYKKSLVVPKPQIDDHVGTIIGLDGRKMSKSYNNVIPLFCTRDELKKHVMRIVTDSSAPTEPKPTNHQLFLIYSLFANDQQIAKFKEQFERGISWADAKLALFEVMDAYLAPLRAKYDYYMSHYDEVKTILARGASEARKVASETIMRVRSAIGAN